VSYLLDEAGNIEYQGLYELITAGGGRGRVGVAVFQSKAQLQQYGGQDAAETLWDAATAKIVLPGGADARALEDMSKLIGETWVERESHSLGWSGPASVQLSAEKRSIFEASEIRTLENGLAFLFYRNLKPVLPRCSGFDQHPRFAECQADAAALGQLSAEASPYAGLLAEYEAGGA
jgi:type IV secretory pathway TraG/TraD family ATPase VirD4